MNHKQLPFLIAILLLAFPKESTAQAPNLGTASSFALFTANGAFSSMVGSSVTGDVGTNVGAFTAFPPGTLVGQIRLPASTQADQAATDITAAYTSLNSVACTTTILPELAGQTLTPGVSCQSTATASSLNGVLTLDGLGNANAVFIIKLNSALTTATNSSIVLTNGACANNVFFQVNGAVDLGTGSTFRGTILANGAISVLTGATLEGRGLSIAGAIALNENSTITVPTSCSISPVLDVVVTAGACNTINNAYTLTGTISLTATVASTLTITDGTSTTTVSVTASQTSASFSLSALPSGTDSHSVTISGLGYSPISTTYPAPASCTVVTSASLGGLVFTDNNGNGVQNGSDAPIAGVVVTLLDGANSPVGSTTTSPSGLYSFTGLSTGVPFSVSFTTPAGYSATTPSVSAPVTLTAGESNTSLGAGFYLIPASLDLVTSVDKSVAQQGDTLTYMLILTNTGTSPATNVVVRDSTAGLTFLPGTAMVPAGTTFLQGIPISLWTVGSISAGQSLTLTYQAMVDSTGVIYNTAIIPGVTQDRVCTSVPIALCQGDEFTLTVPAGRAAYRWYRNGVLIIGATTNVLTVTQAGSYSLSIDNVGSSCSDFSCCPVIFELDSLPIFQATALGATCIGNAPQANGRLVISGFNPAYSYQYSVGSTFNPAASLSGAPQVIPANGVLSSTLVSAGTSTLYTVRVYNGSGCYVDQTVILLPTVCGCPVDVCVPYVITQTLRPRRIGDPIR